MTINERLKILIEALGMNPDSFSRRVNVNKGTTRSYLDRGSKPSSEYLEAIVRAIADINERWLLTGEGEMLKKPEAGTNISGSQVATNTISGSGNTTTTGTGPQAAPDLNIELLKCQMENENLKQQVKSLTELLDIYKRHSTL